MPLTFQGKWFPTLNSLPTSTITSGYGMKLFVELCSGGWAGEEVEYVCDSHTFIFDQGKSIGNA